MRIQRDTQLRKWKGKAHENALGITGSKEGEKEKKLVTPENGQETGTDSDCMTMNA